MSDHCEQMRADWNRRAREDAHYYVAFGGRRQEEAQFLETAAPVLKTIERDLGRLPGEVRTRARRALEIGCGPGRLLQPMSRHFGEIHGVDVSDEMIRLARERLRGIAYAHVHVNDGTSLDQFADESFDFIYSYAVFQHIPSRAVVLAYMQEIRRVLKPGGVFRGQFNGLPPGPHQDTWHGVSFTGNDLRDFTFTNGLQLLALEGARTQYLWTTWRKPTIGTPENAGAIFIRRAVSAFTSETVAPDSGPYASVSILTVNLPEAADLNFIDVYVDGKPAATTYLGPVEREGFRQVNALLPAGVRTGLVPIELRSGGNVLCPAAFLRIIPAGPLVPKLLSITDGIHIVEENRCVSGTLKLQLEEVRQPESIAIQIGDVEVREWEIFCIDPGPPLYEVNFRLPEGLRRGSQLLRVHIANRALLPRVVEIAVE